MRKNFEAKPWTYPQPVFILASYDENGAPDAMNAAWGGISGGTELTMCIGARHKTTANILARKAFTCLLYTSSVGQRNPGGTERPSASAGRPIAAAVLWPG